MKVNESFAVEEQPFQGSIEYDEKLLNDFICRWVDYESMSATEFKNVFLNNRYPNESILKQIAEHKAKIEELKKKLR